MALNCLRNWGNLVSNNQLTAKEQAQLILDNAARAQAMQLGRGNLLVQNGVFETQDEWDALRMDHEACIHRVSRWLKETNVADGHSST